jgi:hypothetical protein
MERYSVLSFISSILFEGNLNARSGFHLIVAERKSSARSFRGGSPW